MGEKSPEQEEEEEQQQQTNIKYRFSRGQKIRNSTEVRHLDFSIKFDLKNRELTGDLRA